MFYNTGFNTIFFRAAVFLFVIFALNQTGNAQERHGDWQLACEEKLCQIFSTLSRSATGEVLLSASVVIDREADIITLIIRAPKRTALPPGLRFWLSEASSAVVPFQYCDDEGCYAIFQPGNEMLAEMAGVDRAVIEYIQYGTNERTALPLSLDGFDDAMIALRAALQ